MTAKVYNLSHRAQLAETNRERQRAGLPALTPRQTVEQAQESARTHPHERTDASKGLRIHPNALWHASRGGAPAASVEDTFARPVPLPGTLPTNTAGRELAMDYAIGPSAPFAAWSVASGVFHEGLAFLGYPYLAELTQRAEYRHISEIWAEHAVRRWIEVKGGSDDKRAQLEAELGRLNVRAAFQEAFQQDGHFGRSQIFLDFGDADNDAELSKPLIPAAKVSQRRPLKAIKVVEPMWCYPGPYNTTNPLRQDFYTPSVWYVYGRTIHASRFLTFVGCEVPDMLKPAYAFGGLSRTQMAKPYVDNWLRTRQSVSDATHSYSVWKLKTNMESVLQGGPADDLFARVDLFNEARDNRGAAVIDKESEDIENVSMTLASLDKLQAQAQEQLASVARIPLSIYLQITPTGLNATSDGETRNFYADVHGYQTKVGTPLLDRLMDVVQLSLWGAIDPDIHYVWLPLWEMSETDRATVRTSEATNAATYIAGGVISNEEERARLNDEEGGLYAGLLTGAAPEVPDDGSDDTEDTDDA